ncbi:MAG: hypothetical protein KatS3mg076_1819 [Candidatus Binatia bacterium]|nr:MAG: hypothetical protein KatS3mg076_1819 [Candidatus Binatia bacterium]
MIRAPEGAARGLETLEREDPAAARIARELVVGDERLAALERVEIYANMYFYRLLECLEEDHPALRAFLGYEDFHDLVVDYLVAHPPSHYSLRHAGDALPEFLAHHPLGREWPFLPELAKLERSILDAFDAPDAPRLSVDALRSFDPEEWSTLRLRPAPAARVLDFGWDVHDLWKRTREEENSGGGRNLAPPVRTPTSVLVWRENWTVYHRRVDPAERVALGALFAGESLESLCEKVTETVGEQEAPERVFSLLRRWVEQEVVSGVEPSAG